MINIDDRLIDQLTEAQMWLLIHVVKRINADGECWPSTETMRKDTKWSDVKKVRKVRDELVNIGILEAYERKRDDGGQASNLYRINTEYIGVYVTAKRLQNLTGGEGKNLTPGVGKEITGGLGKNHTPPNKVLTNEVLTNEQNSLSTESASDLKEIDWMEVAKAMDEHAKGNGANQWAFMCDATGYAGEPLEIYSSWASKATTWQLQNWKDHFSKVQSWMKTAALMDRKLKKDDNNNSTPRNGRVQQQRTSQTLPSPDEIRRQWGVLQPGELEGMGH